MRLDEAHGEEKRLVLRFERRETLHRFRSGCAIGELLVVFGADLIGGAFFGAFTIFSRGPPFLRGTVFFEVHVMPGDDLLCPIHRIGIDSPTLRIPVRLIPRTPVFKTGVVDFAEGRAMVAVRLEVLRQRDAIRLRRAEMRLEVPHLRHIGPEPGHDRRARGTAHRLLHIGPVEDDPASRDAVDVGRLDDGVAVAADFRTQVVDSDEEHIRPSYERERDEREKQGHEEGFHRK